MIDLVLLGRAEHLAAVDRAIEEVRSGRVVVLSLLGRLGSGRRPLMDEFERRIVAAGIEVRRTEAYPATEVQPGGLAAALELSIEGPPSAPTALMIDEAQWADGTSLATVQGVMAGTSAGLLVVGSLTEITGYRRLAFEQLVGAAARLGTFEQLSLDPLTVEDIRPIVGGDDPEGLAQLLIERTAGHSHDFTALVAQWIAAGTMEERDGKLVPTGPPPEPSSVADQVADLDRPSRKLIEAASLAAQPLSVDVAATLLDMPADDLLELGEHLAGEGYLRQTATGFAPVNAAVSERVADRLGEVRRARLYGDLAAAHQQLGLDQRNPSVVGGYFLEAAEWDKALGLLAAAGLAAADRQALGEALPLVEGALQAYEAAGVEDNELEGRLLLARAQCYRLAAWSELAAADADVAASRLTGARKVDALGYATSVADDLQHDRAAERYVMAGLYEAVRAAEPAKHASLLTLHARVLSRLGFAAEADAEFEKGKEMLARHGNDVQQHWGRYNGAWIAFDRGQARRAEAAFEELVAEAGEIGGPSLKSDREAWWSRALFLRGRITEALEARSSAVEHADLSGTTGPVFLSHMSLAEGALLVGRYEEALTAAGDMLSVVLQQGMAWENAARYLRAKAMFGLGRLDEAAGEVGQALEASPQGIDGWRWRLKIRVLQMAIDGARGRAWPENEALTLTDELLHGNWYLTAVELMNARAVHEKDSRLAEESAALAMQLGVPMAAADAIQAGGLWKKPVSAAVVAAVKEMADHMPDEWRGDWSALPSVAPALAAPDVADEAYEAAVEELESELEESLAAAGFGSVDTLLSPAQRRAGGLRRRPRRRPLWQLVAAGLGGASLLAAGVILALVFLADDEPAPTVEATTTTATTVAPNPGDIEITTQLQNVISGVWSVRGDPEADPAGTAGMIGSTDSPGAGVPSSQDDLGYYWRVRYSGDPLGGTPAMVGNVVMFPSDDGNLYAVDATSSTRLWALATDERAGPPALGFLREGGFVDSGWRVYFGSRDGVFRGRMANGNANANVVTFGNEGGLGQIVAAPTVVDGRIYFGTLAGELLALEDGENEFIRLWGASTASAIRSAPVVAEGRVLVTDEGGSFYSFDAATGEPVCEESVGAKGETSPVYDNGLVFVRDATGIAVFDTECRRKQIGFTIDPSSAVGPFAIYDGKLFVGDGRYLRVFDVETAEQQWIWPGVDQEQGLPGIVEAPVVADGVVYFHIAEGSEGRVYALDIETQALFWEYWTDSPLAAPLAIGKGIIYAADAGGTLHAIGCQNPPDCQPGS